MKNAPLVRWEVVHILRNGGVSSLTVNSHSQETALPEKHIR